MTTDIHCSIAVYLFNYYHNVIDRLSKIRKIGFCLADDFQRGNRGIALRQQIHCSAMEHYVVRRFASLATWS